MIKGSITSICRKSVKGQGHRSKKNAKKTPKVLKLRSRQLKKSSLPRGWNWSPKDKCFEEEKLEIGKIQLGL